MYLQKSANLSRGGIYLERTVPHPEGTLLNLRFSLPDDPRPIECKGRIVYPRADQEFGMGLEFAELDDDGARRIAAYVSAAESVAKSVGDSAGESATAEGRRGADVDAAADPKAEADADPKADADADPKADADADPKAEADADPKAEADASPDDLEGA
jgi:hypothetical protein